MCGEDFHLEADYEDRVGNFYPYGDDVNDPDYYDYLGDTDIEDDEDEEDETDDSPIGVATFEVVGFASYDPETDEIRYFEQYATNQSM